MAMLYFIKAMVRVSTRIILEILHRLLINLFDTIFGFLGWPEKKLRIKILILKDSHGQPSLLPGNLDQAIEYAEITFKKNFNINLVPVERKNSFVEVLHKEAPREVLYTKGGVGALKEEFRITGSFFASSLSGKFYPVTAFVVMGIVGASGCSLGPISDYVTMDTAGAKSDSILAHELAHACGLWHVKQRSNLLWGYKDRGDKVKWWQKNLLRSSRHVTYW
jgi:hypothetical protein